MQLPVKAKMKLQGLIDAEQAAQDQALSVTRRISMLSKSLATAPTSERTSTEHEISRLRGKMDEAQRRHRATADQNARLRHFLDTFGPATLEDAKTRPAKIEAGETLAKAAARIRAKIAALMTERQKAMRCGVPIADAKRLAAEFVKELVEKGRPKISIAHDHPFRAQFNAVVDSAWTTQQDIGAVLAWLDPAGLLARLHEDIEATHKPAFPMTSKARAEKLAALEIELLVLEFEDEAIVEASEAEGPIVQRRPDADPRAVLAITINRGKLAPAKSAAKLERIRVADPEPPDPNRRMTQRELIEAFGDNRLPGAQEPRSSE
jgi:hypothetical protein